MHFLFCVFARTGAAAAPGPSTWDIGLGVPPSGTDDPT